MTIPEMPGPMVRVQWVDSTGASDWHDPEVARTHLDKMLCFSLGFMAVDDERGIVLVQGVGAVGLWLSSMAIPREVIREVVVLEPKP